MEKSADAFRTISEASSDLDVPQHVLRFWETRFVQIKPMKRGGGRRYYRPEDIELLKAIRSLLYGEGYTIKGVQRILKEQGVKTVVALAAGAPLPSAPMRAPATLAPISTARAVAAPVHEADEPDEAAPFGVASGEIERRLRWAQAQLAECARILSAANA